MSEGDTNFLNGGGEIGWMIAAFDWASTDLGDISDWPEVRKIVVANLLRSNVPSLTMWGGNGTLIFNDAYARFAGKQHLGILGKPVREAWPHNIELSDYVIDQVFREGQSISLRDEPMVLDQYDRADTGYLNIDYSPILDSAGVNHGVFVMIVETTEQVLTAKRLRDERKRLDQMYAQTPSLMALLEGPEHRFAIVNPAFQRLIGHREVLGKTVAESLDDTFERGYLKVLDQVYKSGVAYTAESAAYGAKTLSDGKINDRFIDLTFQPIRDDAGDITGIFIDGVDVTDRILAEDELAASAEQFRVFAQSVPNHVWTAPSNGVISWFSDRILEYTGLSAAELQNDGWPNTIHPDDRESAKQSWQHAVSGRTDHVAEFRIRRHDGEYRWHLSRAVPIFTDDGRLLHWLGSNTDIHDRKIIEAATARDRDRMWVLTQDLLVVYDLAGHIVTVNPTAARVLGWPEPEMVGRQIVTFIHPDDVPQTEARMARLRAGAIALSFENRIRERSGGYRTILWSVVQDQGRVHAAGRDVTEERKLIRDREHIWKLSPVVKMVMTLDRTIISVNPSWQRTLGWTDAETIGRSATSFLVDDTERAAAEERFAALAANIQIGEHDVIYRTKEGDQCTLAVISVREDDTIYSFGRDVTKERESAKTLAETEEALRQAQKMEAVGQLTGGIAHDFNNLLQGISGSLEIIEHRLERGRFDDLSRFVAGATTAANRAASLTHRLLAFSRRQPLDPRAVRTNPLIGSMEDLLVRTMGEIIDVDMVLVEDLWLTLCDPNQLENALLNLAINARDAMPLGGKLTIQTSNETVEPDQSQSFQNVEPGDYVCIAVTDTGVGMDDDTIKRAFEPFFTTKALGQGTGLGLSMIYGFARQSNGFARIDSTLGEGTTFSLYLPRFSGDEEGHIARVPSNSKSLESKGEETILVVEDEPIVRNLIIEALEELGYNVIEAKDGQQGLDILSSATAIDLLVTDIGLPGINGRDMVDSSRRSRPDLRILFMTGYAENAAMPSGFLEEGMMMITKPFAIHDLAERVRTLLDS